MKNMKGLKKKNFRPFMIERFLAQKSGIDLQRRYPLQMGDAAFFFIGTTSAR
jgi:hypothetical protein